jgi:hypothetical protein
MDDSDAVRVRRDAKVRAARVERRLHAIGLVAPIDAAVVGGGAKPSRVPTGGGMLLREAVLKHLVKVARRRVVAACL